MTRNKVPLAYLPSDAARKTTYKKRMKGLAKKVSELTILCGIEACAIVYSPYESNPKVWPNSRGAQKVIARLQNAPAPDEKRNLNQESFARQRIAKINAQLEKQREENCKKVTKLAVFQCAEGKSMGDEMIVDLDDIDRLTRENISNIKNKMDEFI